MTITARKVIAPCGTRPVRSEGGGRVVGESECDGCRRPDEGMAQFLGREPTPEDAAQFTEDYERLLSQLNDETAADHRPEEA